MKKYLLLLLLFPSFSFAIDSIDDLSVVSHWTCDETSGIRYDSNTTNSNDLTDNNTVGYATGKLGNACDMEQSASEYLSITDADQTGLEPTSAITYSFWIKPESFDNGGYYGSVLYKDCTGGNDACYGYIAQTTGKSYVQMTTAGVKKTRTDYITHSIGTWSHVVVTFNGTDVITYHNGTQVDTANWTGTISTGSYPFYLGRFTTAGYYYDGLIDEITFDNNAWSASDVTAVYNSGTPLPYHWEASSTPTSTPSATTSSSTLEDDNIVFALGIIVFFLTFIFTGFVFNTFRKK